MYRIISEIARWRRKRTNKRQSKSGWLRTIWMYRVVLLGILGVLSYVGSYSVAEWLGPEAIPVELLRNLGIACVISMITAVALSRLVHESMMDEIHGALDELRRASGVLYGAGELGIQNILVRRDEKGLTRERWSIKVRQAIRQQIAENSGEILIACVAAPEFFRRETKVGNVLLGREFRNAGKCSLKVLLLCPDSDWATLRVELEPEHSTLDDIITTARNLHKLKNRCNGRVEFRCYNLPPIAFLAITDDSLFVEAYPMVKIETGKGPIGGRVPMIHLRSNTEAFRRWKGHFMYIWDNLSKNYEVDHAKALQEKRPKSSDTG